MWSQTLSKFLDHFSLNFISNWCTITSAPAVSQSFWNHTCKSNLKTLDCKLRNVLVFNSDIRERDSFKHEAYCTARQIYAFKRIAYRTGKSQELININFLRTKSIHYQEIRLWEMIKWSPQRIHFYLLPKILSTNSVRKCLEVSLENSCVDIGA